jgi:5'-methylthioadenosine phosphorylase
MDIYMSAKIGIIGGSGLYKMDQLNVQNEIYKENAYGFPSAPIVYGTIDGIDADLYFLPRHGIGHRLNPSEVPYQANILALKEVGVDWIISISAVGSLKEEIPPGDMVVVDQFIDRTKSRPSTFFHDGIVAHIAFGDPICSTLRQLLLEGARMVTEKVHDGGTYLCMEGPAFSTRAESNLYRSWGASVIGMTNLPEAKLAREAEISYATLAMSTDYDCWHEDHEDVTVEQVIATMQQNVVNAKEILLNVLPKIASYQGEPPFAGSLNYAIISDRSSIPTQRKQDLHALIGKYL